MYIFIHCLSAFWLRSSIVFIHSITHLFNEDLIGLSTELGTKDTEIEFVHSFKYYSINKVAHIS